MLQKEKHDIFATGMGSIVIFFPFVGKQVCRERCELQE
jgi:hypothetical protein